MTHGTKVRSIPGGTAAPAVTRVLTGLRAALAGTGPAVAVRDPAATAPDGVPTVPAGTAVVLATSGSTGPPRRVALTAHALAAAADAGHVRLGGAGRWLLALGVHHVAGLQVLVRSVRGGTDPVVLDTSSGFHPNALAGAVDRLDDGGRRYTALVPTQLVRALRHPEATAALAALDGVLVGGAALAPGARACAEAAGIRVVPTYGMTETGGGCVYDGVPLAGVRVVREADDGRLAIAGPTLALGYLARDGTLEAGADAAGARFVHRDGTRWLVTADAGTVDAAGHVHVLGRLDDVIVTGAVKVRPEAVERVLSHHVAVEDAAVVGLPDAEWGAAVTALVVPAPGMSVDLAELRARVAAQLGAAHAPRRLVLVAEIPRLGPQKVDRARAAAAAAAILAGP